MSAIREADVRSTDPHQRVARRSSCRMNVLWESSIEPCDALPENPTLATPHARAHPVPGREAEQGEGDEHRDLPGRARETREMVSLADHAASVPRSARVMFVGSWVGLQGAALVRWRGSGWMSTFVGAFARRRPWCGGPVARLRSRAHERRVGWNSSWAWVQPHTSPCRSCSWQG